MEVKEFKFEFEYKGRKFKASCQASKWQTPNYPMYRVSVPNGKYEYVYIFYLTDKTERDFFWYKLPDPRDDMAKAIAKALKDFKETNKVITLRNY